MTSQLAQKECVPCKGGVEPLKGAALQEYHEQLNSGWQDIDEHHLEKTYNFKSYEESVAFANKVASIAIEQDHHPDIELSYGKVKVTVFTHKVGGLTESDFVFAAKVEDAAQQG